MTTWSTFDPGSNPTVRAQYRIRRSSSARRPPAPIISRSSRSRTTGSDTGNYQLHVSIGPPATPAQIISEDIDALVSGADMEPHQPHLRLPDQREPDIRRASARSTPAERLRAVHAVQQTATPQLLQHGRERLEPDLHRATARTTRRPLADLRFADERRGRGRLCLLSDQWRGQQPGRHRLVQSTSDFNNPRKAIMPGWASSTRPATRSA